MSTFAKNEKDASRRPEAIIVLPPTAFSDEWKDRPTTDVAVGLLRLSERDEKISKEQARKIVARDHVRDGKVVDQEQAIESYNDELIRYLMARAMCDPNDSSKPFFEFAEDLIHVALTTTGLHFVWDKWWVLKLSGPTMPTAQDDDLRRLARILTRPEYMGRLGEAEVSARKLLAEVLAAFGQDLEAVEDTEPEDEVELDMVDDGYVITLPEEPTPPVAP
jgi:hypothetical protein